jgi:hypothetical protein
LKSATLNDAGLNMTAAPEMRDLAHRLLTYEAGAGKTSEPMESPTLRVYEKLRQSLGEFVGVAGFQSLASRALALARPEAPSLSAARVAADGSLQGLGEIELKSTLTRIGLAIRRGRNHSHRPLTRPASYLPWRSFNVKPAAGCVARRSL